MTDHAHVMRSVNAGRPAHLIAVALALLLSLLLTTGGLTPSNAQSDAAQESGNGKSGKKDSKPARKKGPTAPKKDVLVFPTDTKGGPSDQLGDVITDVIKSRLEGSELYQATLFSPTSPTFRRALTEQTLLPRDVKPPFDTNAKVQKLAAFAGYNVAVTASLDDYDYDAAKQQVSIVITVTLIDFSSGKPQPRPFGDSAATAAKAVKDAGDTGAVITLARDLTEKIMTELLKPAKPAAK